MKISNLNLYNFRSFGREAITFKDKNQCIRPFTVLIGDNSTGKTTILEAIAKGFIPVLRVLNKNITNSEDFKDLSDADIKIGSRWTAVELTVDYSGVEYSWHNYRRQSSTVEMNELGELKSQKNIKDAIMYNTGSLEDELKTPLVIYFSINRMFIDIPRRRSKQTVLLAFDS